MRELSRSTGDAAVVRTKYFFVLCLMSMSFHLVGLDYWSGTDFSPSMVVAELSKEDCYKNRQNLKGCLAVAKALGDSNQSINQCDANIKNCFDRHSKLDSINFNKLFEKLVGDDLSLSRWSNAYNRYLSIAKDAHAYIYPLPQFIHDMTAGGSSFVGIGVEIEQVEEQIILTPIENNPAHIAGVKYGDVLIGVDGQRIDKLDFNTVVGMFDGLINSTIKLRLSRAGEIVDLDIVRLKIESSNVSYKIVENTGHKFGLIKIDNFESSTACSDIEKAITFLEDAGALGLIMDLRDNLGGQIAQAQCIAGLFLGEDELLVRTENLTGLGGFRDEYQYTTALLKTELPLVTIVNAHTASTSELIAGAFQDYQRSWVIGSQTFGKGSAQSPIMWGGSKTIMLFRTVRRFYLPSGRSNQRIGITPDFLVPAMPGGSLISTIQREEDLYSNALAAEGAQWVNSRKWEISQINKSLSEGQIAYNIFESQRNSSLRPDFQLYSAESILATDGLGL
ncbi:MAG: PDZ domain-containing protein [Bdellovibrionales bacterium]|nr:PDZ domain-containing protein [Bdellovibrionales bacterium]MBT3526975.1 PDZ domain-containing protein [Bdellovibrionales bacterium]MBT7668123.1 PDZ domain-containing protein [Bdellovibrionales bacterium]MBT7767043.1 PDZ domain-containing protein [Bdellovibrionales bacterium]